MLQNKYEDFEPERILYLAIQLTMLEYLFEEPIGKILLQKRRVKLIVFDPNKEEILKWIPQIGFAGKL